LPGGLRVASFKATLEEAINDDLLLYIIDAPNPDALGQIESINTVLAEYWLELATVDY
jgi:50S ribosomal subunit-associated GTPase HflX